SMWLVLVPGASYVVISQIHLLDKARTLCETRTDCSVYNSARFFHVELGAVFIANILALSFAALVSLFVVRKRRQLTRRLRTDNKVLWETLPRLIVHESILRAIALGTILILIFLSMILDNSLQRDFGISVFPAPGLYQWVYNKGGEWFVVAV